MTEERQPNTELRAETLRRLIADDTVSWHQTVAQAYDAGRASMQVEANALIDELKSKATGLADASGFNVTYDVPSGMLHKLLAWRDGAFAASIQAEAQQQIEKLKRKVTLQRAYLAQSPDERIKALQLDLDVEKAAMASCIATIGGIIEGNPTGRHNFLRRLRELVAAEKQRDEAKENAEAHIRIVTKLGMTCSIDGWENTRAEALEKQLAEARAQLAEIHNRFCGENGEPCQVCRLKAEREGK